MLLIALSAGILLFLGTVHMVLTFLSPMFKPRPAELEPALRQAALVLTRRTTFWKAWIGFNGSHSLGAMLFGLVYGYLALFMPEVWRASSFLQLLGLATLLTYFVLGQLYWFNAPNRGITLALLCYALGMLLTRG
jgi:hypothetical protein